MAGVKGTLYRHEVELAHPVRASGQHHLRRDRLFLALEHRSVVGYGEVAPQLTALNGDPGVDDVISAACVILARTELISTDVAGTFTGWRVGDLDGADPSIRWANSLVDMALRDWEMKARGVRAETAWPARYDPPAQVSVSVLDDAPWSEVTAVARVRVKCAPDPLGAEALERLAALSVPILLDLNAGADSVAQVHELLGQLSGVVVVDAVEQPFGIEQFSEHAQLARQLNVAVSLDESVRSLADVARIVAQGSATMICVKPARVGGFERAVEIIERARGEGLRAYVGGFFESPYARLVNRVLARHCVEEPSDLVDVATRATGWTECVEARFGFGASPSAELLRRAERVAVFAKGPS